MHCQDGHYTPWTPYRFHASKAHYFGRQRLVAGLGNAPGRFLIAIHRGPPEIITHPWIIIKRQVLIHSYRTGAERVNGIERNAFISFRIHEFIKRLAFEKCIAGIHPFFPCGRCEFIKFNCREIRFSFRFLRIASSSLSVSCFTGSWDFCSSMNISSFNNMREAEIPIVSELLRTIPP